MNNTAQQLNPSELDRLAFEWQQAKADEESAKKRRFNIETEILSRMPSKDEGTVNQDEQFFRVSCRYGFTRSIDIEKLTELEDTANQELKLYLSEAFPPKYAIDLKVLRYLEDKKPEIYTKIAQAITSKPSKPAISIKELN